MARFGTHETEACPACEQAKAWMTAYGIPFEERDIDATTEYVQQLRLLNRRMSIPTFDIDGNVVVGFNPRRLVLMLQRRWCGRLNSGRRREGIQRASVNRPEGALSRLSVPW